MTGGIKHLAKWIAWLEDYKNNTAFSTIPLAKRYMLKIQRENIEVQIKQYK